MSEKTNSNAGEYSVTEVSSALKRTVEDTFGYVRVRGEISGFRGQHSSGHAYFSMKDEKARLEAVIWKGVYNRLKVKPEEGLEVIATGKITTYPGSSKYQIVIDSLEPAGIGALMALLEERKRKLTAEGLFDPARKQLLPYLPRVIGVITSPTGAVIRDIMHRLDDRFATHVLLWPVRVQGETSGTEVANAITGFNQFDGSNNLPRPDLLIVARGGGSLEDLWSFNDEAVVRAAAASNIPVISAVGHETDWTLIDHAADQRAPTPTGAAEMAVPVRADLLATLDDLDRRQKGAVNRHRENQKNRLHGLARAMPSLSALLALPRQRLDEAAGRLPRACNIIIRDRRARLERVTASLSFDSLAKSVTLARERLDARTNRLVLGLHNRLSGERATLASTIARLQPTGLERQLKDARRQLVNCSERGMRAQNNLVQRKRADWQRAGDVLHLVSYQSTLARGFALVRDENGKPVKSAKAIKQGVVYSAQFADGQADIVAINGDLDVKKITKSKPVSRKEDQGNLF